MFGRNSSRSWDIPCTKASEIPDGCIRFLATLIWQIGSCLGLQVTYAINRNLNMCKVLIESLLDIHVALQFLNFIWFHSISMFALREHLCKHDKPVRMTCHTQCLDFLSNSCQSAATVANWNSSPWRVGELDIVGEENWKKNRFEHIEKLLWRIFEYENWTWRLKMIDEGCLLKCYSGLGKRIIQSYTSPSSPSLLGISRTTLDHFESLQLQAMPAMQHIFLRSLCQGVKTC